MGLHPLVMSSNTAWNVPC